MKKGTPSFSGVDSVDRENFFTAVLKNDAAVLKDFIARGYNLELRNGANNTALAYSLVVNNPAVAGFLLDSGADVNARCNGRATPLLLALRFGLESSALRMIAKGADFLLEDQYGESALKFIRSRCEMPEAYRAMWREMPRQSREQEISDVIRRDNIAVLKLLVEEEGAGLSEVDAKAAAPGSAVAAYIERRLHARRREAIGAEALQGSGGPLRRARAAAFKMPKP